MHYERITAITVAGVELLRRIHKDQSALNRLRIKGQAAPAIWNAVLAAQEPEAPLPTQLSGAFWSGYLHHTAIGQR
jgi:hypothetical protein